MDEQDKLVQEALIVLAQALGIVAANRDTMQGVAVVIHAGPTSDMLVKTVGTVVLGGIDVEDKKSEAPKWQQ